MSPRVRSAALVAALLAALTTHAARAAAARPALRQTPRIEGHARHLDKWNDRHGSRAASRRGDAGGLVESPALAQRHAQLVRDINALYAEARPLADAARDRPTYGADVAGTRAPPALLLLPVRAPTPAAAPRPYLVVRAASAAAVAPPVAHLLPRPHALAHARPDAPWWQRLLSYLPKFLR